MKRDQAHPLGWGEARVNREAGEREVAHACVHVCVWARVCAAPGKHVSTFSALCEAVLPEQEWQQVEKLHQRCSVNSFGRDAESVAAMAPKKGKAKQSRRQRDMGKIVALVIKQVLALAKAGQSDMAGVLRLALQQRELEAFVPSLTGDISSVKDSLSHTVAKAWRVAKRQKDEQTAKQLLSLLVVQPMTDAQVQVLCSGVVELQQGSMARVRPASRQKGRFSLYGGSKRSPCSHRNWCTDTPPCRCSLSVSLSLSLSPSLSLSLSTQHVR